jgi:hypothetical protein
MFHGVHHSSVLPHVAGLYESIQRMQAGLGQSEQKTLENTLNEHVLLFEACMLHGALNSSVLLHVADYLFCIA